MKRRSYASDEEWALVEPYMPKAMTGGRPFECRLIFHEKLLNRFMPFSNTRCKNVPR
jgi:transposase